MLSQLLVLNEMVLLSTQNIMLNLMGKKILQFYAENFCLSKPGAMKRINLPMYVILFQGPD